MTDLGALAARAGVLTEYQGATGAPVSVAPEVVAAVLDALGVSSARDLDERERALAQVEVRWDEPPYGYEHRGTTLIIRAPRLATAFDRRRVGVFAPTYALVREARRDAGDLAGLRELFDWAAAAGAPAVLTLPLGAVFPEAPSPYSPVSRLHWNELHLPLDAEGGAAHAGGLIDYPAAFARVHAWLDRHAALTPVTAPEEFAIFRAASDTLGRDWRRWPASWRRDAPRALAARYELGQQLMRRELRALRDHVSARGGLLGLDLPLGAHPDGYDAWRYRDQFAWSARAGAPPDLFFPSGQNWGFAPPLPAETAASGYEYFTAALRAHLEYASFLRIDHVMQFRRLYFIPEGFAATEGTYVSYPFEHYLAILCVESVRAGVPIVGENLGLVPDEVNRDLDEHGLYGTWVAQGALDGARHGGAIDWPGARTLASLGTHDMPTWAGYCAGTDIDIQCERGVFSAADAAQRHGARRDDLAGAARALRVGAGDRALHDALVVELSRGDAELVVLNVEDLWLEPRPQNVPGTSSERPNWRRPLAHRIDAREPSALVARTSEYGGRDGHHDRGH